MTKASRFSYLLTTLQNSKQLNPITYTVGWIQTKMVISNITPSPLQTLSYHSLRPLCLKITNLWRLVSSMGGNRQVSPILLMKYCGLGQANGWN